jgi:hypothetical protein
MSRDSPRPAGTAPVFSADDDFDDTPWEPDADFGHVFIRVTETGECLVSGPKEEVEQLRKQIVDLISDGRPEKVPDHVHRFQIDA